ncbi:G5 domain-containing protein, partial [Bifidobacterium sp. UBA6881]
MARRWTPQRFVTHRRIRVAICVASLTLTSALAFGVGARKTVALTVNGETTTVTTYAMSVDRLLQEQGVKVKTHDLVESTTPTSMLKNHDVVTVKSAYQTTITINGQEVPFWTVATSAEQLLGFFEENEAQAAKVTVNIGNVYNKLTGGLIINQKGPVTVIADGKTSVAPNGKLPAASILDSKGITVGKEDRVSVEKDNGKTVLRVQRVTHGTETRTETVPFGTQTIVDQSLQPGEVVVRQEGQNGEIQKTYSVTYVDGVKESEELTDEKTTKIAIDRIIAVGPEKTADDTDNNESDDSGNNDSDNSGSSKNDGQSGGSNSGSSSGSHQSSNGSNSKNDSDTSDKKDNGSSNSGNSGSSNSGNSGNSGNSNSGNSGNSNSGNSNSGNSGNSGN